jgi:hypothetical protein
MSAERAKACDILAKIKKKTEEGWDEGLKGKDRKNIKG